MKKVLLMLPFLAVISLSSCEKDNGNNNNNPSAPTTGSISLEFEHNWDGLPLTVPHSGHFMSNSGEHIIFSKFSYYLSNIQLIDNNGDVWTEDYSYHLLDVTDNNTLSITIDDIPTGDYVGISYMIGVDSTSNVSGPQSGALDPVNEMFWSWNNGYIFLKAEGMEHMSSTQFRYHIGGFRNSNSTNAIQELTFDFGPMMAEVRQDASPVIHSMVDAKMLFDGPTTSLKVLDNPSVVMPGPMAVNISRNYREMIEVHHIHN
jgi:hypothetical protein